MEREVYVNEATKARAILTTESPSSSYGLPVLRVEVDGEHLGDLGPADVLPSGLTAGQLVRQQLPGLDEEARALAERFLGS